MKIIEWKSGEFEVTTDQDRLEIQTIHDFLALESEWARGITRETVERSIEHSLCFGVFHRNRQVGFARVITDYATMAYLGDVLVLKDYRGRGLAKWLMECVVAHPGLQGLLALDFSHGRCTRFVSEIWVYAARPAGEFHGAS
jgi:GNAT superfamily N-acetyltransferase